jgi:sulfhydrogenase subunit beta (sulfur reductase)
VRVLERAHLDDLLGGLTGRGYELIGPKAGQGAIAFEPISSSADLPIGLGDAQDGGTYRLEQRSDEAVFGFANGPQSWKRLLHPPVLQIWSARRSSDGGIEFNAETEEQPKRALIGVRSCDLHAIATLDRSLLEIEHPDPEYAARREGIFVVALNCSTAGGTCFCVSMDTGPRASFGFDLVLTELLDDDRHLFLVDSGSERGEELLASLPTRAATAAEVGAGEQVSERTAASMGRRMETEGLKELLDRNLEHPRWDEVSERCLSCGNCTMVCPTCFCTEVDDVGDLAGERAERLRRWDSCFNLEFTYVHGGSVRGSQRSRYRQWMTHKLATWHDQFGTSGCVGCGRCITWCPVAIDITEEAAAIRVTDGEVR